MRLAVVDFETYWAAEHSLTKMLPITYRKPDLTGCW